MMSCGKKEEETKPIRKDVTETVFATGILEADNTYSLTAQTDGYLSEVNFNEGDIVEKGRILAVINNKENLFNTESAIALYDIAQQNTASDAPALAKAKNEIVIAKQNLEQDSLQWIRYKKLLASNSIAKVDYENARLKYLTSHTNFENAMENYRLQKQVANQSVISNKAQKEIHRVMLNNNNIQAVVSGKVYEKRKEKGDFVKAGDVIAVIGDAQDIYAKVNIDESNISKIKVGQTAVVQLNINKQKEYKATVKEIYPAFDDASQSFLCKLNFDDPLDFRITGTQLQADIVIGIQKNALLIPRNYLNFDGTIQVKGEKQNRKVEANFVSSDWVQIIKGIDDNTTLVTENVSGNKSNPSELSESIQ
jgi:multidrug efflux pump subunit AcrA (membrane-fusion protein)